MNETMRILKSHRNQLTKQQFKTLKGQCLAGNEAAAIKGLNTILQRRQKYGVSEAV